MKKVILGISMIGVGIYFISRYAVSLGVCLKTEYVCRDYLNGIEKVTFFFLYALLCSLVTYYLSGEISRYWTRYAAVAIPLVVLCILLINQELHHNPGGWFNMDAGFDRLYISVIQIVFVMGSLIAIYRGYRAAGQGRILSASQNGLD